MAFPFVFGDSYGGVQAAQQADVNSDRSFTAQLIAAQQQAQRMAMEQANQNAQFSQGIETQRALMAQRAAEFNANLQQQEADRALKEDLGLGGLDVAEQRIQAVQDQYTKKLQQAHDDRLQEISASGPTLASQFSKMIQANKSAEEDLAAANQEYLKVQADIEAKKQQGYLRVDPKDKTRVIATGEGTDEAMKASAEKANNDRQQAIAAFNEAKRRKAEAEHDFEQQMRLVTSSGFVVGDQGIVHKKTGQPFPFVFQKVQNSPEIRPAASGIRVYDPKTGTISGGAPTATVAPATRSPGPPNSAGWGFNAAFNF